MGPWNKRVYIKHYGNKTNKYSRTRMSTGNGKITSVYCFLLVMIKAISYERTLAVYASMDFKNDLGRSELWGDSRWSRWRKETMKTGIRIQNISKKIQNTLTRRWRTSANAWLLHGFGCQWWSLRASAITLSISKSANSSHHQQTGSFQSQQTTGEDNIRNATKWGLSWSK